MATSKAQQNATNKWIAKAYDRINLTVPKGRKEIIQAHAEANGESVNGFINRAIDSAMGRNTEKPAASPQNAAEAHGDPSTILAPNALKIAQEAAQRAGEDVPTFVSRAVTNQDQRDKVAFALKASAREPNAQN